VAEIMLIKSKHSVIVSFMIDFTLSK